MMKFASGCCLKPFTIDYRDYDGISYTVDVCSGCGKEVDDPVLVHSCCGVEICGCERTCGRCGKVSEEEVCERCMEIMLLGAPEHRFQPDANFFKEIGVSKDA